MLRPSIAGDVPKQPGSGAVRRADRAMSVLQYGAAILAIVVVTLLDNVR